MNEPESSPVKYALVLAERDPAFIRYIPAFSKRRRAALSRLDKTVGGNHKGKHTPYPQVINLRRAVERTSTVTIEMALDYFGGEDQPDMIHFFISAQKLSLENSDDRGEMLARAILSYRGVFDRVLPHGRARYLLTSPHDSGINPAMIFRIAKSSHREFFSYEDLSAMQGDVRVRFEAILTVLARNMHDSHGEDYPSMSNKLAELIMDRPDRAHDILRYQDERGIALSDIKVRALREYLDTPAPSLSSGIL